MGTVHLPVMTREVIELLEPKRSGKYLDATVGMGGHSVEILRHLGPDGLLIATDRDDEALERASQRLEDTRARLRKSSFSELEDVLEAQGIENGGLDGVLMDFGLSMFQLRAEGRGFSFSSDDLLDMRMDPSQTLSAREVVNRYPERELADLIFQFGEERRSRRIAKAIVFQRRKSAIKTCRELAQCVEAAIGRRGRIHPATRTFQAIRMEVNNELEEIRLGLGSALRLLAPGGRLVAIAYHSLEDRIVKNFIRDSARAGRLRVLTKKPLRPTREEVRENPSARSARLRAAEVV